MNPTILDGSHANQWIEGLHLSTGAENVTIQDLTIQNFTTGVYVNMDGGCLNLERVKIKWCDTGLKVVETYQTTLDMTDSEVYANKTGLLLAGGSSNNTILNGNIHNNTIDGVRVEEINPSPSDNIFDGLTVSDNAGNGFLFEAGTDNQIFNCSVLNNNTGENGPGRYCRDGGPHQCPWLRYPR